MAQRKPSTKQTSFVLWLTGLSGAGKTTLANALLTELQQLGLECEHLDGDDFRREVTPHLGFSLEDRRQNVKSAGYLARALARHGIPVICSFVSPSRETRNELRRQIPHFIELFVDAPLPVVQQRDPKGLYKAGANLTGAGTYEAPLNPDLHLYTAESSLEACVQQILKMLWARGFIPTPPIS